MGSYNCYKKRNRSRASVSFEKVENLREKLGYTIKEISELLSFSTRQYNRCRKNGKIPSFRYFALKQAIITYLLTETQEKLKMINDL